MSRAGSLLISTGIHLAIGFAVFSSLKTGSPNAARKHGERGHVLVVELLPLPDGGTPGKGKEPSLRAQGLARPQADPGEPIGGRNSGIAERSGSPPSGDGGLGTASGMPGVTDDRNGAPTPSGAEIEAFRATLLRHIERYQQYPQSSREAGEQGLAKVRFIMDRSGRVLEIWIEATSGSHRLDAESLAAIARAQPLPSPPAHWPQSFQVSLPLAFKLD